jgi:hypothetical protein
MSMIDSYEGRVVIRQGSLRAPATATILVNSEHTGWEIAIHEAAHEAVEFDASRLLEVKLPTGRTGRFVQWRQRPDERRGIGIGWPPTAGTVA